MEYRERKRSHARSGGDTVASLTARPFGRLREGTRNTESTRFRHRHAGELQRINRKSKEQENVQCFRNRGGCTEKRDSAKLHGGTARKQEENTLCGYRTKFLPLCESGKRILRMAGLPTGRNHKDLEFLVLRKYTPEERIAIVREAIYRTENVGLVVIDGIRDMVYDINSPSESTKVISLLMTWTGERHIHIHTILHQNKGDENARGHIGTELSNKAETVLQVEKDEKDPRHQYGQGSTYQGDELRTVRIPHQRGGIARTAGRIPVQTQGSGKREKGEVRPLQGHHREAAPHRTGSGIHTQR